MSSIFATTLASAHETANCSFLAREPAQFTSLLKIGISLWKISNYRQEWILLLLWKFEKAPERKYLAISMHVNQRPNNLYIGSQSSNENINLDLCEVNKEEKINSFTDNTLVLQSLNYSIFIFYINMLMLYAWKSKQLKCSLYQWVICLDWNSRFCFSKYLVSFQEMLRS